MLGYGFEITINPFQFTHPGRGATTGRIGRHQTHRVSIHAPREGCDDMELNSTYIAHLFQFTHPGRGATCPIF